MTENPKVTKAEKEWIDEFSAVMQKLPRGILFSLTADDFESGSKSELSLMKKTYYGAGGIGKPFKVRCA